jgi:lipopolysaccharide heptosyltransferase II
MVLRTLAVRAAAALRRLSGALGEVVLWAYARRAPRGWSDREPASILVLRNNDLGDMLIITPLFAALRRRFPEARIAAATGRWNLPVLAGNPHISEVLIVNAPWFNKFVPRQSTWQRLRYLISSPEVAMLRRRRFDVGIDVLGSRWGAALLLRAGIPRRLGVRGYAGGHSVCQDTVTFDPAEQVGRSALRFAELLGATELPPALPQVFLTPAERTAGQSAWRAHAAPGARRIVVAPGSGLAVKSWPLASYAELTGRLAAMPGAAVVIAGGPGDRATGERLAATADPGSPRATNLAGHLSLREIFALVAAADLVVCNSSVTMHAAAAFGRPTLVLLGESFSSARQHQAQWGYPGISVSLGKEPGEREAVATPAEAMAALRALALDLLTSAPAAAQEVR